MKKVLIIYYDKQIADLISKFIQEKNYFTILTQNAKEGLEICKKERPESVILDLFMPNCESIQFLLELRSCPELANRVSIIITSVIEDRELNGFRSGIIDCLKKPIDVNKLTKIISDIKNFKLNLLSSSSNKATIVDTDEKAVDLITYFLEKEGYIVRTFSTTENIYQELLNDKPDFMLVNIDIDTSVSNGLEIIKTLKSNPGTKDILIIGLSSLNLQENKKMLLLSNITDYNKVYNIDTFLDEIYLAILKLETIKPLKSAKILIADDSITLSTLVKETLDEEGFQCVCAKDGEEAIQLIYKEMPDLILLDINMPKKDGYQVFKEIKSDVLVSNIPIILSTARSSTKEKILGLELGADDYITKPYDIEELMARIKMVLKRITSVAECNPLTKLPGNVSIEETINTLITQQRPFAVIYIDMNDFKAFNDYYGFIKGDELIRSTARVLLESIKELGYNDDFIGHIGGDDFIIITHPERVDTLCKKIIEKFDKIAPSFYEPEDRERGYIETTDRRWNIMKFPIISLAIGVATTAVRDFISVGEVSKIGTEMKKYAKKFKDKGSYYAVDRRRMK